MTTPRALTIFAITPSETNFTTWCKAGPSRAAPDLLKIDYLSSSGVAILVGLKRRIDTRNGKMVFFHVQPIVHDLLKVMKLDRYFPLADDEQAAIASLRPAPTI